jgi:hypothetical protein
MAGDDGGRQQDHDDAHDDFFHDMLLLMSIFQFKNPCPAFPQKVGNDRRFRVALYHA